MTYFRDVKLGNFTISFNYLIHGLLLSNLQLIPILKAPSGA